LAINHLAPAANRSPPDATQHAKLPE